MTAPIRIALLTPLYECTASSKSGIAKHYRYLADALDALGHEVTVLFVPEFFAPIPTAAELAPQNDVRMHCQRPALPRWADASLARRTYVRRLVHVVLSTAAARRQLQRLAPAPDIIEATSFGSLGLAPSFTFLRPRIVTRVSTTAEQLSASFQGFQSRAQSLVNRLERRAILRSGMLVTHTQPHAQNIESGLGLRAGSFAIVPHGIPDLAPIAAKPPSREFTVLFAGQFTARKGIDVVLAAVPKLLKQSATYRFVVAGGSRESRLVADQLNALEAAFGARFSVIPDPDDDTLRTLIERCDLFTAPSRYESFGLVYLEAMRAGKAVVATCAGGIPEVVAHGETGLLVPPGDADALADAWLQCASNPGRCEQLGQAGRRRFLDHFSAEIMARRSVDLYQHVITRNS